MTKKDIIEASGRFKIMKKSNYVGEGFIGVWDQKWESEYRFPEQYSNSETITWLMDLVFKDALEEGKQTIKNEFRKLLDI